MLETEDDSNMAYSAGKKYARRLEHLEREQFNKKLSGFLARRGFSYRDIFPVIEQIWNEIRDPEDQNNKDG
jgi:regulatory protein